MGPNAVRSPQTNPHQEEEQNAKKLLPGAILGGVILFVWGAISHTLLPLST